MGRLERLFDRFRKRGDVTALGKVFDLAAPELLGVASHLRPELTEAEDLVQNTFLVAIERASRWDRERRLMPWLCGILVNQAHAVRRREARKPDPDRLRRVRHVEGQGDLPPDQGDGGDPACEVQSAELSGIVSEALQDLPALYREVLVPHLVDEKRAVDIAHELGRAPGTVRMQIQRGLVLLRRSLPPGLVAGGVIATATRGHAAVRAAVVAKAELAAPSLAAAATIAPAAPLLLGGLAVSTKLLSLVVGAAGLAVVSFFLWKPLAPVEVSAVSGDSAEESVVLAAPQQTVDGPVTRITGAALGEEQRSARVRVDAAESTNEGEVPEEPRAKAPGWFLTGTVRGFVEENDAAQTTINVFCFAMEENALANGVVNADGTYEVDLTEMFKEPGPPSRELLISVHHVRYASGNAMINTSPDQTLRDGSDRTVFKKDLRIQLACGVRGVVEMPEGLRFQDVDVALFRMESGERPAPEPLRKWHCEEEGDYEIKITDPDEYVVVAYADGFVPASFRVTVTARTMIDLAPLVLDAGDASVCGTVLLPEGSNDTCRVTVRHVDLRDQEREEIWNDLAWDGLRFHALKQTGVASKDGSFCVTGLSPGLHDVSVLDFESFTGSLVNVPVEVDAPAAGLVFDAGRGSVTVLVYGAGEPIHGAEVQLLQEGGGLWMHTNDEGLVTVLTDPAREYELKVSRLGYEPAERSVPAGRAAKASFRFDLVPSDNLPGALALHVPEGADPPLPEVSVTLTALDRDEDERKEVLQQGAFRVGDLMPGRYKVSVEPHEHFFSAYYDSFYLPDVFELDLASGEEEHHSLALELGGRVQVRVQGYQGESDWVSAVLTDSRGEPVDVRAVTKKYEANVLSLGSSTGSVQTSMQNELYPNLAPGTYTLTMTEPGHRFEPATFTIAAGKVVEVTVFAQQQ